MGRIVGRVLLIAQACLIVLCVYGIADSYTTPYKSEWLTSDAFVPFYLVAMLVLGFGMLITYALMQRVQRNQ